MGCATTSRRFEREMLFTPRSTLRENFTVVPLDVKKDRTPHTSAKRRPAAQVDLHKHRSCRLWLQPAQRTDSPTTHASPRTTRSAKRASPRNAARKGAVHVHDGLPPFRHRRPDRLRPVRAGACLPLFGESKNARTFFDLLRRFAGRARCALLRAGYGPGYHGAEHRADADRSLPLSELQSRWPHRERRDD